MKTTFKPTLAELLYGLSYAAIVTLELLDQPEIMKSVEVPKTLFPLLKSSHAVIKVNLENEVNLMYMSYYITHAYEIYR